MIRWRPQSLIAQTIIVLLVGLTASHLLSMVVYSGDRSDALTRLGDRAAAARIADAAALVLRTPAAEREATRVCRLRSRSPTPPHSHPRPRPTPKPAP